MKKNRCRCGREKVKGRIVCIVCWKAMPAELRDNWNAAKDTDSKRAAARAILDHFIGTPSML